MKTMITPICPMKESTTVQVLCVLMVPSTKVCSNICHLSPSPKITALWERSQSSYTQEPLYFTLAVPRRAFSLGVLDSLGAFGAAEGLDPPAGSLEALGGGPAIGRLRPSRKLCQKIRIGLATKTDE